MMSSSMNLHHLSKAVAIVFVLSQRVILGFTWTKCSSTPLKSSCSRDSTRLHGISKWNKDYQSADEDDEELITKEMFMRDMLSEPVRRKKKGSKYNKPHDNRDALPFVVKVKTPDPYTSSDEMMAQAKENSKVAKKNTKTENKGPRKSNLVGMDSKYSNGIASSIFTRKKDGTLYKVLGQFELDKNTNCGDLLQVGEREFEVVTARSQFKYAGGKRFVMVRKILEVKEITRIAEEATLTRLMEKGGESASVKNFE